MKKREFRKPRRGMSYGLRIILTIICMAIMYMSYMIYVTYVEMQANKREQQRLERGYKMLGEDYKLKMN